MKKPLVIILNICIPVVMFWVATFALIFTPHGYMLAPVIFYCFAACFILGLLLSLLFFLLYFIGKKNPAVRKQCALSFAVTLGLLIALVSSPLTSAVTWEVMRPARERVAQRILTIAQDENYESGSEVYLRKGEYYLSDNGPVYYYNDGRASAVMFWDTRGVLHGSGSLYVSAPEARPPINADIFVWYKKSSAHWWTGDE